MNKQYNPNETEPEIYNLWEKSGYFNPDKLPGNKKRRSFTIILPPPNASGKMHTGNVLMIAIEDLLIRWKRMQGFAALWVPGTDHAGFETQITFERQLKKEGKSRFNFDRETLYKKIWEFVHANKKEIEEQIKSMGASVDWSRYRFTLDKEVIETVHETFRKMHEDGLIYRDDYMVNFCPNCGTTFADLEVKYIERTDPLYYIRYPLVDQAKGEPEYLVVATVRPEPIYADTHIAVNPKDKKRNKWIGRKAFNPLTGKEMEIIGDEFVDPKFGTGIVKLTPAHDKNDYEVAKKHNLPMNKALDLSGRMIGKEAGTVAGMKVVNARKETVKILEEKGLIEKIDTKYLHTIATCYKGGHDIEPMIVPNWFVKVDKKGKSFKKPALDVVKNGKVKIYPKWREKTYTRWMEEMHDWPISRQIVWGIRIPVWYDVEKNPDLIVTFLPHHPNLPDLPNQTITGKISHLLNTYTLSEIQSGLQNLFAPAGAEYVVSPEKPRKGNYLPETDTFDTWFSSGQWPLVTLGYPGSKNFKRFYPTDVMETGWEIIRLWVSRMIMFGLYLSKKPPFHSVYLHGIVRATDGRKMSKSLGNVINPDEYQKQFGTDALRMGLISGTSNGKDFNFPKDRVIAYRNFANKLWNMARFLEMQQEQLQTMNHARSDLSGLKGQTLIGKEDKVILSKLNKLIKSTNTNLEKYRFSQAAEDIYHFVWDEFASGYLEYTKSVETGLKPVSTLYFVFLSTLKLLHPFMPFVTEAIWQELPKEVKGTDEPLLIQNWPSNVETGLRPVSTK